jgi:hypothetical protein
MTAPLPFTAPATMLPRFVGRAAYEQIPAVNWTTLREMRRSPLHYRYRCDHPAEETAPMRLGRAVHAAVLEPERFARDYVVFDGPRRQGKAWEAFEADALAAGKEILKADEHAECLAIAAAVRAHPLAAQYLAEGRAEQTIAWVDTETGLPCKGRVDWLCDVPGMAALVDLKTTAELDAYRLGASIARLGHHAQIAFYSRGLRALGLVQESKLIAVESEAPYDVALFAVAGDALTAGDEEVGQLLRRVAECREKNEWPGRYDATEQELRLPPWLYRDAEDAMGGLGITVHGEAV